MANYTRSIEPQPPGTPLDPYGLVGLRRLMAVTRGSAQVPIGLVDGPVRTDHPDLAPSRISLVGGPSGNGIEPSDSALRHGTFMAGLLVAGRDGAIPGIAPDCPLLVRAVLSGAGFGEPPRTTPDDLAAGVVEIVRAGARVVNLSLALTDDSQAHASAVTSALDFAAQHGVLVVTAAGNHSGHPSTALTRHPWVIPVLACDSTGALTRRSTVCASFGARGLRAPGENIAGLSAKGGPSRMSGTSAAAAFVTGALALLWSLRPALAGVDIKAAVLAAGGMRTRSVVPPLLNVTEAASRLRGGKAL